MNDWNIPNITAAALDPKNAETIECDTCGCHYFVPVMKVLKYSKLHTGKPKDTLMQIPVLRCSDCGDVIELEK